MSHNCCDNFTRSQLLRAAAPSRRGPAVDRDGDARAGGHRAHPALDALAAPGMFLTVYGASKIPLDAFETGIAEARGQRQDPRHDLLRRRHRRAQRAGAGRRPGYRRCGRTWRCPKAPGRPLPRTRACAGTPPRPAWGPARGGQGHVFPAISYDHPNQSHFTSRHFYEVGALDVGFRPGGWAAGSTTSATTTTRSRASRWRLALADARDRGPAGVGDRQRRRLRLLDPAGLRSGLRRDVQELRPSRRRCPSDRQPGAGAPGAPQRRPAAHRTRRHGGSRARSSTRRTTASPATCRASRSCSRRACRCGRALSAQRRLRHALDQVAGFGDDLESNCLGILAFQQHLEQRGLADRVLVVWSEFGRRPEENDSQGTDHGAAGVGFLVGTKASGQIIGEFPGLATASTTTATCARPATSGRLLLAAREWLGTDAAVVIPGESKFVRPTLVKP